MKLFNLSLRSLLRDWRSGELQLVSIAVIVAVTAVTTVGFFTDRVKRATEQQSSRLLAADLVLLSSEPIPERFINKAREYGLSITRTTSFRSVVVAGEQLQLAEIKAVEDGYPHYGNLRISSRLFGQEKATQNIPQQGEAWLDSRLFQLLSISPGDQITLGKLDLIASKVLTHEPDRGGDMFNIAPRTMINQIDLKEAGLLLPGSRAKYRLLMAGEAEAIHRFSRDFESLNIQNIEKQGVRDARPELKSALNRTEQFLGLAALSSIALAGLAIALSAQRFAKRHFDHCAIMRCLGMRRMNVFRFYLYQLTIVSFIASLTGCLLGYFFQAGLARLLEGVSNTPLPAAGALPVIQGMLAGLITVLGFALPELLRLNNVSPLRVLRRDLAPLPTRLRTAYILPVLALALLSPWQTGQYLLTFYLLMGLLLTLLFLSLGARLFISALNQLRPYLNNVYRYGLANIQRRAQQSSAQIIAIGLGITVMLLLGLIRTDLLDNWQSRIPEGTPNYFLINIQPGQVDEVKTFIKNAGNVETRYYPMVRGRLVAINGESVVPEDYEEPRAQRLASREFNLSWATALPEDNEIAAGEWWTDSSSSELSVEEGIAETLGISLNDSLTYRIAGEDIRGEVTSLRELEWDSFNVNFFVIAKPSLLEESPATYITSFYLSHEKRKFLAELVKRFPSITVIDVDAVLTQIRLIMRQVIRAIEYVFIFTLIAGIVVLLAALKGVQDERIRETALLFALGARHKQVKRSLIAEFSYLGVIAGILAAFTASGAEWLLGYFVLEMETNVNYLLWLIAPLLCAVIIIITGLFYTRKVFHKPPLESLRQE